MAAQPLSVYHPVMRALLGDEGDELAGFDFNAAQLNGAMHSVLLLGYLPCLTIGGGNNDELTEAPAHADTGAFLALKAVHLMTAGERSESIKSRAMTISVTPAALQKRLHTIEYLLEEVESRGNICSPTSNTSNSGLFATSEDFMTRVTQCLTEGETTDLCCE